MKDPDQNAADAFESIVNRHNAVREALEALVDREGISDVLGFLCEVCASKAEANPAWAELANYLDVAVDYALEWWPADDDETEDDAP